MMDAATEQRERGMADDRREWAQQAFDRFAEMRFTCPTCKEPIEDGHCPVCNDSKEI